VGCSHDEFICADACDAPFPFFHDIERMEQTLTQLGLMAFVVAIVAASYFV
jgi:hypothetical protein